MDAHTSAFEAQDALYAIAKRAAASTTLSTPVKVVSLGWPIGDLPEEFLDVSADIRGAELEDILSNLGQRDDTYDLQIQAFTTYDGHDWPRARKRLREIYNELAARIDIDFRLTGLEAPDPGETPTGPGSVALARISRWTIEAAKPGNHTQGMLTVVVRCQGWVS
jgi:hypothetical protein